MPHRWPGLLALALLLPSLAPASTIYRCEDDRGNVNFTDARVPGARCRVISADVGGDEPVRPARRVRGDVGEITLGPARASPPARGGMPAPLPGPVPVPGFIDASRNVLEAGRREVIAPFAARWRRADATVRILHLGDSHVHNGFAGDATRRALQAVRGDGGRGLVFPYALARTYAPSDYRSAGEGAWQAANSVRALEGMPVGIAGVAARTSRTPAAFTLDFPRPLAPGRKTVKLFLRGSMPGLRLTATAGRQRVTWSAGWGAARALPVAEFELHDLTRSLRIDIESAAPGGRVEVHGASIEGARPGVIYHSMGVDGATLEAVTASPYLAEQLAVLQPDLILLDFGSNELINSGNALPANLEAVVTQAIRRLRAARPDAVIVLATPQDMNFQGRNVSAARAHADLMRRIALQQHCLFWDWYRIAGGPGSMRSWAARGLANRDQVHLVARGYQLKGELLAKALLASVASGQVPARAGTVIR